MTMSRDQKVLVAAAVVSVAFGLTIGSLLAIAIGASLAGIVYITRNP